MILSNFDIHFDEPNGTILIVKTPGADGRAATIEIKPSDFGQVKSAIETGEKETFSAEFEIEINKE